ncbi:MAG: hypothetical protein SVG88_09550 [Halobacteriales archaeon]|nr:hypothetical protein [Halobacteriales archaeon]
MYITQGLVEILLEYAADADPDDFTAALATTPAGELTATTATAGDVRALERLDPDTPVFTHVYLPTAGRSVSAVFGVDLATSPGRTHGRFIAHPDGHLGVSREDDLHAVVLVAVPPWSRESIAAFDRAGRSQPVTIVAAAPEDESIPESPPGGS